jgi:prepilin-type N-terminal cleavage/methylation domain-containing protein
MNPRRAFTLIELLIVVAIIVILVGLIIAGLESGGANAQKTKCAAQLKQLGAAVLAYAEPNAGYLPPVSEKGDTLTENRRAGFFREDVMPAPIALPVGLLTSGYYWNLGLLWRDQHVKGDGQAFFCPSQPEGNKEYRWESYSDPKFHPEGAQDKAIYLPYYYNPITESGLSPAAGDRRPLFTRVSELGGHPGAPPGVEWKRQSILVMDHVHSKKNVSHVTDRMAGTDATWNVVQGDLSLVSRVDQPIYQLLINDEKLATPKIPTDGYAKYDDEVLKPLLQGR